MSKAKDILRKVADKLEEKNRYIEEKAKTAPNKVKKEMKEITFGDGVPSWADGW